METNAKSLVDHWTWAANKGVMNPNTAAGLRAACTQILAVVGEGWEDTDVATLDVENLLIRFQNLRKKDFCRSLCPPICEGAGESRRMGGRRAGRHISFTVQCICFPRWC
jgi:hypothetical protein